MGICGNLAGIIYGIFAETLYIWEWELNPFHRNLHISVSNTWLFPILTNISILDFSFPKNPKFVWDSAISKDSNLIT